MGLELLKIKLITTENTLSYKLLSSEPQIQPKKASRASKSAKKVVYYIVG